MQPAVALEKEQRFDWPLCYEAEKFIIDKLADFTRRNPFAARLEAAMRSHTGTILLDWVDHIVLERSDLPALASVGYVPEQVDAPDGQQVFWHPEAMLPRVLIGEPQVLALKVDSLSDFMVMHRITAQPEGSPLSCYRHVTASREGDVTIKALERRGYRGYIPSDPVRLDALLKSHELWKTRPRIFDNDAAGFEMTLALLDRIIASVGKDMACHIVFAEERAFWQLRNRAGQIQKRRQDQLGLGWANHDHHTFRSSRQHFVQLMRALEKLGFERRERYYAGAEAGWGAQILEQPVEGIVAFCDVDLEPNETSLDFSRQLLPPSRRLGTIGLWVGLHGESFLDAGMHHLECRFDHELLREQLASHNVNTMKPFSDFPFLRQAFTEGERWQVRPERVDSLLRAGLITADQAQKFKTEGAIGSHLENLQRKGGFKGFNQKSVSVIIDATDPRKQPAAH